MREREEERWISLTRWSDGELILLHVTYKHVFVCSAIAFSSILIQFMPSGLYSLSACPFLLSECPPRIYILKSLIRNGFRYSVYRHAISYLASGLLQMLKQSRVMFNDHSHNGTQIRNRFRWFCTEIRGGFLKTEFQTARKRNRAAISYHWDFQWRIKQKKCRDSNALHKTNQTQKHHQIDWEVLRDTIEIDSVSLSSLSFLHL